MRTRSDETGPLSPQVLYVLLAVMDRDRHGYGIMKEVEARTDGKVTLLPNSLYATLKRMLDEGLVEKAPSEENTEGGRPRQNYKITSRGREIAEREVERLSALLKMAREKRFTPAVSVARPSGES